MSKKNAFLANQQEDRKKYYVAGASTATQQFWDMLCLVLNDPAVMGKDVFGAQRLLKIREAIYEREAQYHEAWIHTMESDYYQEKLDAALRDIFGNDFATFYERYDFVKEWDYSKPCGKG